MFLKAAQKAAEEASQVLLESFNQPLKITPKGEHDFVTNADLAAEKVILEILQSEFPEHSIFSEEAGEQKKDSEYYWAIDPLDGTLNYSRGIPIYGISIGLLKNKKPILGVIYNPSLNLKLYAEQGKGAFCNGKQISVSNKSLPDSFIVQPTIIDKPSRPKLMTMINELSSHVSMIRLFGSGCYELGIVARGKCEGLTDHRNSLHDVLAGVAIIQEAGGLVTDWRGNPWIPESPNFIASNRRIHSDLIKVFEGIR